MKSKRQIKKEFIKNGIDRKTVNQMQNNNESYYADVFNSPSPDIDIPLNYPQL